MKKMKVTSKDRLISVGDLICKGPHTRKTLDLAMRLKNLKCIMGNHEYYLLYHWKKKTLAQLKKDYQHAAIRDMGRNVNKYMRYISKWPFYIKTPQYWVIHAGIRPGKPLSRQTKVDLTHLRKIEPQDKPWYEMYTGETLIVHGHWAKQGLIVRENVVGLDTGCVYGKRLTALILPEKEIVSVPARKAYIKISS